MLIQVLQIGSRVAVSEEVPMGRIRLGCLFCDRDDFDGVEQLPTDWYAVDEVQSYEQSYAEAVEKSDSVFDWQTHIGVCPDCETDQCRLYDHSQQQES